MQVNKVQCATKSKKEIIHEPPFMGSALSMKRFSLFAKLVFIIGCYSLTDSYSTTLTGHDNGVNVGDYTITPTYTDTLPTALLKCFESHGWRRPVGVHIKNNSNKEVVFTVSVSIQDYTSSASSATKSIAAGDTGTLSPTLFIDPVKLATLSSLTQSNYQVSVSTSNGEHHNSIYKDSHLVQLMAADVLPWNYKGHDMSGFAALWVTPTAPAIETFLATAKKYSIRKSFVGYEWGKEVVPQQVKAIFKALKKRGMTYVNGDLSFPVGSQRIRLPSDALREASANCIDGSILMASALEAIDIEPLLVLIPGHCFLGWKVMPGSKECEFLETTMIGTNSFEDACRFGYQEYINSAKYIKAGRVKLIDTKLLHTGGFVPFR